MRTPSPKLQSQLTTLRLCTRGDVASCEPQVRKLCCDLPDFDSVWLDAFVQRRLMTPFQADCLTNGEADRLLIAGYRVEHALGSHSFVAVPLDDSFKSARTSRHDRSSVARGRDESSTDDRVVLSLIRRRSTPADADLRASVLARIDSARSQQPRSIVVPRQFVSRTDETSGADESFAAVSFVDGWTLSELLIRGGRFPASAVAEIGRELLTALAWLESIGLRHGAVTLRNVVLGIDGRVTLVNPFVRRWRQPTITLSDRVSLRDCEGVAPEQLGSSRDPDARSELHALGCLLWQLLTSRPVVLNADPVQRLLKLAEHDVADARGLVPNCPDWLARQIHSMTRRAPELRPSSASDVLKHWQKSAGSQLAACRRLASQMPDRRSRSVRARVVKPADAKQARASTSAISVGRRWLWPATATAVLSALVLLSARSGVLPQSLRFGVTSEFASSMVGVDRAVVGSADAAVRAPVVSSSRTRQLLPSPDAGGVMRLLPSVRYHASSIDDGGAVKIVCDGPELATISVLPHEAFAIAATSVEIVGVQLEQESVTEPESADSTSSPTQLVTVRAASLVMNRCVVQSPSSADRFVGVSWHGAALPASSIAISDCVFAGGGYGISFDSPPQLSELHNVLLANRGGGVLCEFSSNSPDLLSISANRVTQRFGFSFIDAVVHSNGPSRLNVHLVSQNSVFAPRMAIVRLQTPDGWTPSQMQIHFRAGESGYPAIVPPETTPVVWIDPALRQPVSLPDSQTPDAQLLLAEPLFQTPTDSTDRTSWQSSVLEDFDGPKLTPSMPGIDATRLP